MKTIKFSLCLLVALICNETRAGLQIPYVPDGNTTHLWHFDGAFTNADGTTNILTPDAVATGGITLTNVTQTQVPGSTITLGNLSYAGLSNCLHIIPTNLVSGNTYAFASGGPALDSTLINGSSGGAFTFEAVVKMDVNPIGLASGQNWEIICGDNSANGTGVRGWQFRIVPGTPAKLEFNAAPGLNANINDIAFALPNSGPDIVAAGQWYHVAVTYTGSSPTNSDTARVLTFYWTLLDANRTNADVLAVTNVQSGFGIVSGVTASIGVGGNGRANNGVANNEGFKGYIDEARMSIVARHSNEMAFTTGGTLNPPSFLSEPPTNTFIGYGQTLTLPALASGTPPLAYQWYQNGTVALAGQTNNALALNGATFASAGNYTLVVTNNYGSVTSSVAQVTIGATPSELFNTGMDTNGDLAAGGVGVIDPHYTLVQSADTNYPGPGATIWNMASAPTKANGGRFFNPDSLSQWIGPNNYIGSPSGIYVYETHFLIDQADASTVTLQGNMWVNVSNMDIVVNGQSQGGLSGATLNVGGTFSFTITNGLQAGSNTVDFITTNSTTAQDTESAFRVELSGLGQALPAGLPVITNQPADQTVVDAVVAPGSTAAFSVVALGRPPLSYQWWSDGAELVGATTRTLQFTYPTAGAQGTNFFVVISNDSGSVTSRVAVLTLEDDAAQFVIQPTNLTVTPGLTAAFTAVAVGYPPLTYQWFKNGAPVSGANGTNYSFTAASGDNNATIVCYVTNTIGATTYVTNSVTATLTVLNPQSLVWLGQNGPAWDTSTPNWTNVSTASLVAFAPYDSAIFDDRGGGQSTVNLTQALNPLAVTVDSTANYSFDSSGNNGSLTGPGTLTKANTGSLVIDVTNNLTGSVMISGGTVQIGNNDTLGAIGGTITNNASLILDRSDSIVMPSPIYGTGTVTMNSGNVTASGSNYYTGATYINNGITMLANAAGLGATNGSITVNAANNAELYITANVNIGLNPLIVGGSGVSSTGALRKGGAGTTTYNGPVTLTTDTTMAVDSGATLNLTNSAGVAATSSATLTLNGSGAGNITGPLSLGSGNINVNGGTWTVAPSNNLSGLTTLNGGVLRITGAQSFGQVPALPNASQVTLNRGTLEAAANITLNDGNIGINVEDNSCITKDTNVTLTISNPISGASYVNLTNAGPGTLILNGANSFSGTLFMDTGSQTANDGKVVIANPNAISSLPAYAGLPYIIFRNENSGSSTLALDGTLGSITVAPDISLSGRTTPSIENLAGDNTISGNFTLTPGGAYILQSDSGTLSFTQPWPYPQQPYVTSARSLTLTGSGIIAMAGGIQDASFGSTNIPINVFKSGSGILTLPVANAYSGTTVVSNGVLLLTSSIASTNTVTVAGGLLVGNGNITGPVTVQAAGAIEAGATNTIGTLNFSSTLALSGKAIVKISKAPLGNDQFAGQTSVTYGGTLTVTNLGGTLTTNDTFTLFTPGASASNFASIVGSPGPGLKYTFTNGVLSVAIGIKPVPHITGVSVSGTTLTLSGTNGAGSGQYVLLGSTSMALPLSQWTPLLTNYFDANGSINLSTNIVNLALPQEFYILSQ